MLWALGVLWFELRRLLCALSLKPVVYNSIPYTRINSRRAFAGLSTFRMRNGRPQVTPRNAISRTVTERTSVLGHGYRRALDDE